MTLPAPSTGEKTEPATPRRPGDIPVGEILAWLGRWKIALAIAAGAFFRLAGYFSGRSYWMDENSLAVNLWRKSPADFFGPLEHQQLAPPGFLVAVWSTARLFGDHPYAMRLIPIVGGIASLFLFLAVARRCLPAEAVFPALVMFAVANDLIYFASELKQYSTDLASSLACLLAGLTIGSKRLTSRSSALLGAGGAAIVWFSHPSIFVLASIGLVGLSRSVASRDWRWLGNWCLVGASWLASFAVVHAVSIRQLAGSDQMWRFWDFAFPPIPPRSIWDGTWVFRRLAYYFINPLSFDVPFGARLSMLPAIGLAILGGVRLWKLDRGRWALLMLPVALSLLASALRLYPFHGRVVVFLAPIPLLAIAAGLDAVRQSRGRGLIYYALAAMVLVAPIWVACEQLFNPSPGHNRFGDLDLSDIDPYRFPL